MIGRLSTVRPSYLAIRDTDRLVSTILILLCPSADHLVNDLGFLL